MARPVSILRLLYGITAGRTRALAFGAAAASCAAKVAIVVTALVVARGWAVPAVASAVVLGVLFAAQRVLQTAARVGAECDVYRAASARLLASDVLEAPVASPQRTIFESGYYARTLVTDTAPELAASCVAAIAIAPVVVHELPSRAILLAAAALAVVLAGVAMVRRWTAAWSERIADAHAGVARRVILAAEGRLEIVASGSDAAFATSLESALESYRRTARRGAWGSALVGRAPLAAGAAVVAAVVVLDGGSDAAVTSALLANALVLASALPVVIGVVTGANELVRLLARVDDVVALLSTPARRELGEGSVPDALAPVDVSGACFAYDDGAAAVLRDVSFTWRGDEPLVLEGANGSGKSTLLRLLLGLRGVGAGRVAIGGEDVSKLDVRALRRATSYLPQDAYLGEPGATVRDAVRMIEPSAGDDAILRVLEEVDLLTALRAHGGDPLDVDASELSTGQRQRLALARALVRDARMYLLDEPDANVDRAGVERVAGIVRDLAKSGKKVVVAAHTPELADVSRERVRLR